MHRNSFEMRKKFKEDLSRITDEHETLGHYLEYLWNHNYLYDPESFDADMQDINEIISNLKSDLTELRSSLNRAVMKGMKYETH